MANYLDQDKYQKLLVNSNLKRKKDLILKVDADVRKHFIRESDTAKHFTNPGYDGFLNFDPQPDVRSTDPKNPFLLQTLDSTKNSVLNYGPEFYRRDNALKVVDGESESMRYWRENKWKLADHFNTVKHGARIQDQPGLEITENRKSNHLVTNREMVYPIPIRKMGGIVPNSSIYADRTLEELKKTDPDLYNQFAKRNDLIYTKDGNIVDVPKNWFNNKADVERILTQVKSKGEHPSKINFHAAAINLGIPKKKADKLSKFYGNKILPFQHKRVTYSENGQAQLNLPLSSMINESLSRKTTTAPIIDESLEDNFDGNFIRGRTTDYQTNTVNNYPNPFDEKPAESAQTNMGARPKTGLMNRVSGFWGSGGLPTDRPEELRNATQNIIYDMQRNGMNINSHDIKSFALANGVDQNKAVRLADYYIGNIAEIDNTSIEMKNLSRQSSVKSNATAEIKAMSKIKQERLFDTKRSATTIIDEMKAQKLAINPTSVKRFGEELGLNARQAAKTSRFYEKNYDRNFAETELNSWEPKYDEKYFVGLGDAVSKVHASGEVQNYNNIKTEALKTFTSKEWSDRLHPMLMDLNRKDRSADDIMKNTAGLDYDALTKSRDALKVYKTRGRDLPSVKGAMTGALTTVMSDAAKIAGGSALEAVKQAALHPIETVKHPTTLFTKPMNFAYQSGKSKASDYIGSVKKGSKRVWDSVMRPENINDYDAPRSLNSLRSQGGEDIELNSMINLTKKPLTNQTIEETINPATIIERALIREPSKKEFTNVPDRLKDPDTGIPIQLKPTEWDPVALDLQNTASVVTPKTYFETGLDKIYGVVNKLKKPVAEDIEMAAIDPPKRRRKYLDKFDVSLDSNSLKNINPDRLPVSQTYPPERFPSLKSYDENLQKQRILNDTIREDLKDLDTDVMSALIGETNFDGGRKKVSDYASIGGGGGSIGAASGSSNNSDVRSLQSMRSSVSDPRTQPNSLNGDALSLASITSSGLKLPSTRETSISRFMDYLDTVEPQTIKRNPTLAAAASPSTSGEFFSMTSLGPPNPKQQLLNPKEDKNFKKPLPSIWSKVKNRIWPQKGQYNFPMQRLATDDPSLQYPSIATEMSSLTGYTVKQPYNPENQSNPAKLLNLDSGVRQPILSMNIDPEYDWGSMRLSLRPSESSIASHISSILNQPNLSQTSIKSSIPAQTSIKTPFISLPVGDDYSLHSSGSQPPPLVRNLSTRSNSSIGSLGSLRSRNPSGLSSLSSGKVGKKKKKPIVINNYITTPNNKTSFWDGLGGSLVGLSINGGMGLGSNLAYMNMIQQQNQQQPITQSQPIIYH